jgi:hypothetical protein
MRDHSFAPDSVSLLDYMRLCDTTEGGHVRTMLQPELGFLRLQQKVIKYVHELTALPGDPSMFLISVNARKVHLHVYHLPSSGASKRNCRYGTSRQFFHVMEPGEGHGSDR